MNILIVDDEILAIRNLCADTREGSARRKYKNR